MKYLRTLEFLDRLKNSFRDKFVKFLQYVFSEVESFVLTLMLKISGFKQFSKMHL